MLDDKLRKLRIRPVEDYNSYLFRLSNNDIAQIKQAFADEGWTHKPFLKHLTQTDDTPVYTGQEWLSRFEKARIPLVSAGFEDKDGKLHMYWDCKDIIEAAKKASGLK